MSAYSSKAMAANSIGNTCSPSPIYSPKRWTSPPSPPAFATAATLTTSLADDAIAQMSASHAQDRVDSQNTDLFKA